MIYIIMLVGVLLGILADKKDRNIYYILIILVLGLFVGLRAPIVGDDTKTYYQFFSYTKRGIFSPNIEYGFSAVSYILLKLFNDSKPLFIIYSVVTNVFFITRLRMFRNKYGFTKLLILYLILFYPLSCNIMRQCLAISIVFWATKYLEKGKNVKFAILTLIATSFHLSAILSLVYIPISLLIYDDNISKRKRSYLIIGTVLVFPVMFFSISRALFGRYAHFFYEKNNSLGFMNITRLLLILAGAVISREIFKKNDKSNKVSSINENRLVLISSVIGVMLYFMGYFKTSMMRIGYFFGVFEMLYIVLVCSYGRGRQIMKLLYGAMVIFLFVASARGGWSELAEYSTWIGQ